MNSLCLLFFLSFFLCLHLLDNLSQRPSFSLLVSRVPRLHLHGDWAVQLLLGLHHSERLPNRVALFHAEALRQRLRRHCLLWLLQRQQVGLRVAHRRSLRVQLRRRRPDLELAARKHFWRSRDGTRRHHVHGSVRVVQEQAGCTESVKMGSLNANREGKERF